MEMQKSGTPPNGLNVSALYLFEVPEQSTPSPNDTPATDETLRQIINTLTNDIKTTKTNQINLLGGKQSVRIGKYKLSDVNISFASAYYNPSRPFGELVEVLKDDGLFTYVELAGFPGIWRVAGSSDNKGISLDYSPPANKGSAQISVLPVANEPKEAVNKFKNSLPKGMPHSIRLYVGGNGANLALVLQGVKK